MVWKVTFWFSLKTSFNPRMITPCSSRNLPLTHYSCCLCWWYCHHRQSFGYNHSSTTLSSPNFQHQRPREAELFLGNWSVLLMVVLFSLNRNLLKSSFKIVVSFKKKTSTPPPTHVKLLADEGALQPTKLTGKLNWLTHTKPHLAFGVQSLNQFMQSPRLPHYQALIHTVHYVHTTVGQEILLKATDHLTLQAYSDSDCQHIQTLGGQSLVVWCS